VRIHPGLSTRSQRNADDVMGHGRIVFEGTPAELKADQAVRREWLEV
jgi:ABC-type branched-subunit amino acid transport system ATPase component